MLLKSVTLSSVISLAAAQSCASLYYQCGGLNWNGTTCCEAGSFCKSQNPYYYQCVASVTSANDTIAATQQADVSLSTSIPESVAAQSSVDGTNWNSTIAAAPHIPTPKATKSKKTVFVTKPASDQATITVKKTTSTAPATLRHKHASSLINLNTSLVEIINTPSSAYETSIYSPASLNVTSEQPSATESVISETGADASIVSSSIISQGQPDIPTTIVAAEPSSSVYSESSESSAATVIENEEPAPSSTVSEIEESATVSSIAQPSSTVDSAASAESSAAVLKSSDAVDNELTFTPIAGGKSGTGETTRYWDCCKPSCAWSGKADVSSPVAACKADGKTISDVNDQSGCNGGDSYMCSNQQPFAINSTLAFGFAAASMVGYGESNMCCTCVLLTFNDGPVAGKQMVAQITNTGSDLSSNHFDIAMPGGGFGIFNQGCPNQWNSPASNWGQTYGGVSSESDCGNLPSELQTGCDWRWDFLENADNPSVSFVEIECPSQITDITGCKRN